MSDRMHVGTRKGVFTIDRGPSGTWSVTRGSFLGDNCSMVLHDPRDGALYAAIGHGHFGAKLHRSRDDGRTWEEVGVPTYPPLPEGYEPGKHPFTGTVIKWSLKMIWELRPGGPAQDGVL